MTTEWEHGPKEFLKLESSAIDFSFDFGFDEVEGLDKVEHRVEERMKEIISEEVDKVCLKCGADKLLDESENEYYCLKCEQK